MHIFGGLVALLCKQYLVMKISTEGLTVAAPWRSKLDRSSRWWWPTAGMAPWAAEARVLAQMGQVRQARPGSWAGKGQKNSPDRKQTLSLAWRTPHQRPMSPCIYRRNRRAARKPWRYRVTSYTDNNCYQNIHRAETHWANSGWQNRGCIVCQAPPCQRLAPRSQCRWCWEPERLDALTNSCTDLQQSCLR